MDMRLVAEAAIGRLGRPWSPLWLSHAYAEKGSVVVPGRPSRDCADLVLQLDGIRVQHGDASLFLPWSECLALGTTPLIGGLQESKWALSFAAHTRYGPRGIAVRVGPGARAEALRRSLTSWKNRIYFWGSPEAFPLRLGWFETSVNGDRELSTITALAELLRTDSRYGKALAEPHFASRVADSLHRPLRARQSLRGSLRRSTVDIRNAMRSEQLVHRVHGRPYRPFDPPPLAQLIDRVLRSLDENPHVAEGSISRSQVEDEIRRNYADVEPWPFPE